MFWQRKRAKLLTAIREGDPREVQRLLEAGANPRAKGPDGEPLLLAAVETGDAEVVRRLLAAGADPNAATRKGEALVFRAMTPRALPVAKQLLRRGADPNVAGARGDFPIHLAAYKGHIDFVKALLRAGADVDRENADGLTPLMAAARGNRPPVVTALLEAGANPDVRLRANGSVRDLAAKLGHVVVVRVLDEFADSGGDEPAVEQAPKEQPVLAVGGTSGQVAAGPSVPTPTFAAGLDPSATIPACLEHAVCDFKPHIEQQRIYAPGRIDENGDVEVLFEGVAVSCGATRQFGRDVARKSRLGRPIRYGDLNHIFAYCCGTPSDCPFHRAAAAQREAIEADRQMTPRFAVKRRAPAAAWSSTA